ncbi:MAG: iron donor protein CyaY [Caldimonas sp.]
MLLHAAILSTMNPEPEPLSDIEYERRAQAALAAVEATADRLLQEDVIDIDAHRTGGLLELAFPGGGTIVINTQPPLHELWLAAPSGGFHFRMAGGRWIEGRDGGEFFAVLSACASALGGKEVRFEG